MKKIIQLTALLSLGLSTSAVAENQKISLLLDWFVNPDHAAIIVAQQKGFFAKNHLDVKIIEPADPSMPPKLVASEKADLAVDYQPQLQMQVSQGLPLVRIATLVDSPLNSLVVLDNGKINHLSDLKGKKIGYSVSGFETTLLDTMLKSENLSSKDVKLVNVNWSLSPALISHQVDAVIGSFRNFELNQLALEGHKGKAFFPEKQGVPNYDELIVVANKKHLSDEKLNHFVTALEEATDYLNHHPKAAWQAFVSYKPKELDTKLNRLAWKDTLPYLAKDPRTFEPTKYQEMAKFMQKNQLIKPLVNVADYAVQLPKIPSKQKQIKEKNNET